MLTNVPCRWLVLVLLAMFALLTVRINAEWYGHHDENGRWISTAVRNYQLYGMEELGYLVTTTPGPADPTTIDYYVNHPPLIVWLAWLFAKIFGFYQTGMPYPDAYPKEMAVRLVSIFATMISLSAFYVMCRRLLNQKLALLCLIFYGFTPMIAYFGRMPNHEPLALPFIYLFAAVFVNWMRRFTISRSVLLTLLAGVAMWTAWVSAFFFAMFGVVALLYGRKQQRIAIIGIGIVTVLATISVPLFYEMQQPGAIADLLDAFVYRTSNRTLGRNSEVFTAGQFITQLLIHMVSTMTLAVVVFGGWGIFTIVRHRKGLLRGMILALLGAAVIYMLVFRNAFHVHDYYKIVYMPGFAICTASVVHELWQTKKRGLGRFARPLVMAIVICSSILSVMWFGILHRGGMVSNLQAIPAILGQYTSEDDIILTNLEGIHPVIDYYAYRTINYGIEPQAIFNHANSGVGDVYYLYCIPDIVNESFLLDNPLLIEVVTDEGNCRLLRLEDADS